jgi:hypothetical protein
VQYANRDLPEDAGNLDAGAAGAGNIPEQINRPAAMANPQHGEEWRAAQDMLHRRRHHAIEGVLE